MKNYYDDKTGDILTGSNLVSKKDTSVTVEKSAKEALLTDGNLTPRNSLLCYKTMSKVPVLGAFGAVTTASVSAGNYLSESGIDTRDATYVPLIIDLGQQENISVVQIILPSDASTTSNPYRVELNNTIVTANSITIGAAAGSMSSATGEIDPSNKTVTFKFPGDGEDSNTCPLGVYNRFKLARFYTDYTAGAANPWIVRGYSTGKAAALTFDPKYNAGIAVDITINGGNMQPAYYPKVDFNLNRAGSGASAGSPPILNCLDPTQIVTIFNDYNLLVNSDSFRSKTQTRTLPIQNPNEKYTAITVKKALQVDNNTCAYMWTDKVMNVTDAGNYAANGSLNTIDRVGIFPYPFDTQNFTSYERVLDISGINIFSTTLPTSNTLIQSMQTLSGFTIPEKYRKSVTLDT
ncbi:MAG: hypothetical protein EB127_18805, partial [Alphaproteobacteria bacterium]|nr:hypothetical protein [Alphaproteobacteria bacterium]